MREIHDANIVRVPGHSEAAPMIHHHFRPAVMCAVLVIGLSCLSSTAASAPNSATSSGLLLGSYNGAADPSGALAFANETGTTASLYSDYLDGTSFGTECTGTGPYPLPQITGQLGNMRLELSVPLPGYEGLGPQATLAAFAANPTQWDQCFTTLGQDLVADGFSNAIIRLMWEPDSGIYSNDDLTSAANYATLWRDAWNSAMSVPGADFQWAWYWGGNFDATTNQTAWPGSQYVDYVTFDLYDQSWDANCGIPYDGTPFTAAEENCLWNGVPADYDPGLASQLDTLAAFAASYDKPLAFGEFGVINRGDDHGGGDDPTFINNLYAWVTTHNVAWMSYFNFNSGGDSVLSDFPNSLAAFKADFGGNPSTATVSATPTSATAPSGDLSVSTGSLPSASRMSPYTSNLTAQNVDPPERWKLASGALPPGIRLSSAGALSGMPRADGDYAFDVEVTDAASRTQARESATAALSISVTQPAPVLSQSTPTGGPGAGGTRVTITGTSLESASSITFGGTPATIVRIKKNGSSLTVLTPPGSGSETIAVTTPGGSATGAYTYMGPNVSELKPAIGTSAGGTTFKVRGTDLQGATVTVGGKAATDVSVNRAGTLLSAVTPAGSAGDAPVVVTTPAGSAQSDFTYQTAAVT